MKLEWTAILPPNNVRKDLELKTNWFC